MSTKYRVSWKVPALDADNMIDYDTPEEANAQADDIGAYEGVTDVVITPWTPEVIEGFQTTGPVKTVIEGDVMTTTWPVDVPVKFDDWKGEDPQASDPGFLDRLKERMTAPEPAPEPPKERFTRVFTLDPRAVSAKEVFEGLTMLLKGLEADMVDKPDMFVRFETDPDIEPDDPADDEKDTSNDLAKALEEQAAEHDPAAVRVNDFAKAIQTAMRKNGVKNCGWVVVTPNADKDQPPRFHTGGTERTHNWLRESLELAAAVRMQLAQNKSAQDQGLKVLQSGLAVPERPPLVMPGG